MASFGETISVLPLQFRDEQETVPIAQDLADLGMLIEDRVKPGLDSLLEDVDLNTIEYAGYALITYLYPQQRFAFMYPRLAEDLKLALVGIDMDVSSGPIAQEQDIHLEFGSNFDVRAMARKYPQKWHEGVSAQAAHGDFGPFSENAFVLGPTVRQYWDSISFPPNDSYNQPVISKFSLKHAVSLTGAVLLPGLFESYPKLTEGFAIPVGYLTEELTNRFGLEPRDTTWLDWHLGYQRFWDTHQAYPSDPYADWLKSINRAK